MTWIWKHFTPEEVLSPDGIKAYGHGVYVIQPALLDALELFRHHVGSPLVINHSSHVHRGYRSPDENELVGGEEFSFHMQGLAADIAVLSMSISELKEKAYAFPLWKGIGYYPNRNFVHCDLRSTVSGNRMTWEG